MTVVEQSLGQLFALIFGSIGQHFNKYPSRWDTQRLPAYPGTGLSECRMRMGIFRLMLVLAGQAREEQTRSLRMTPYIVVRLLNKEQNEPEEE